MDFFKKIEENIRLIPEKKAIIYGDDFMTYGEVGKKSDLIANWIINRYGEDKTPIIVYGHKENNMIPAFLGCLKSGHAYIPVETALPLERIENILENSEAKLIINISDEIINTPKAEVVLYEKISESFENYKDLVPDNNFMVKKDDICYILYTSGSTGKPKGVKISFECLDNFLKWGIDIAGINNDDVILNQISYSFDVSVMSFYFALVKGASLFTIDKKTIADFKQMFNMLGASGVTVWNSTPSFAEMLLSDSSFAKGILSELKTFMFCGEVLTNKCVEELNLRFENPRVFNFYGPTEATVAVTAAEIDKEMLKTAPLPLGYSNPGCKMVIVGEDGKIVPDGEKGEIIITGNTVGPGYKNNEEKTKEMFFTMEDNGKEVRAYRTGDIGYISDGGLLHYCGRKDFQIKLNGYRIEIEDIENNMRKVGIIKNGAVIPVFEDGRVSYLSAFVTLNEKTEEKEFKVIMKIKNELKEYLPDYMVPRKIVIKEVLPTNNSGKIDRKKLMEEIV